MEEKKMFAFCLIGRNPEFGDEPVVRFGTDRKKVLDEMIPFFERDGGMLCELEEFDVDPSFLDSECFVETKDGVPWKLYHKEWESEEDLPENFFFAEFIG